MAKKSGFKFSKQNLGIALIVALIIQYVLPAIHLGVLSWIGTLLVLLVALYLLIVK